jgi:SAM-dependent methyltransferase
VLQRFVTSTKGRLRAAHFRPGPLGLLTNPFYFARSGLYRALAQLAKELTGRMLDVGCGNKPYAQLFRVDEHVGLELDSPAARVRERADVFYDGVTFPFADGRFDSVFASQVFEHVFNPDRFLDEVSRVLTPTGQLLLTMPFVWDEHEQPHDFARYSSFGITHLLEQHGFEVITLHKSGADLSVVLQTWGMYVYKALAPGSGWTKLAAAGLMTLPVNIIGSAVRPLFPKNPDLYLDLVVLAKKRPRGG